MKKAIGVILAAGEGKRFHSEFSKTYACLLGKPFLQWVSESLIRVGVFDLVWVIREGEEHLARKLKENLEKQYELRLSLVIQGKEKGTGAAVRDALSALKVFARLQTRILIVASDQPALQDQTLKKLLDRSQNDCEVCALRLSDPTGYGRLILNQRGTPLAVKEEKDCSEEEKHIHLVVALLWNVEFSLLKRCLPLLELSPVTQEVYLTDLMRLSHQNHGKNGYHLADLRESVVGVNTLEDLERIHQFLQKQIIQNWMRRGVRFIQPQTVYLDSTVRLSPGLVIPPGVVLHGDLNLDGKIRLQEGEERGEPRPLSWFVDQQRKG